MSPPWMDAQKVYREIDALVQIFSSHYLLPIMFLTKKLNAPRLSEHPPVNNVKTFRWDHRLQKQNLFMAFNRVPPKIVLVVPNGCCFGRSPRAN